MASFIKVATLSEVPAGAAKAVDAGGMPLALYNVGGRIYATTNICPHRGGPLGEGDLDEQTITCPWHAFQYDVTTGKCVTNPALSVSCYPVRVEEQDILVQV
ncbi:MAG: non-heme iron oxygenase ferredoxin subunit [Acidobacteria bacterium]|nr:non-heme iron oxygenase ferredoxin subunit [Acidobacteriota bacterium]